MRFPQVVDVRLRHVPQHRDLAVGEAELFRPVKLGEVADAGFERRFLGHDIADLPQEEAVDLRRVGNGVHRRAEAQQLRDRVEAVVGANFDVVEKLRFAHAVELRQVQVERADLQRTDAF